MKFEILWNGKALGDFDESRFDLVCRFLDAIVNSEDLSLWEIKPINEELEIK